MTNSSGSCIAEEERSKELKKKRDEETRVSEEVIDRKRERDEEEGMNSRASNPIRG